MRRIFRIYPSIGVARVGNSESENFIGPEFPGQKLLGPFRDTRGKIKRQAARFRIYEYHIDDHGQEKLIGERVTDQSTSIVWDVHLANTKAASGLFPPGGAASPPRNPGYEPSGLRIDPGPQTVSGANTSSGPIGANIEFIRNDRLEASEHVTLGELRSDELGRLLVLGGFGKSHSPLGVNITQFANNRGWYDDIADGPVRARVQIDGGSIYDAEPAWVVVTPPAYAPNIENLVTWYDLCVNINAEFFNPINSTRVPSFTRDIYPILKRTTLLSWVSETARQGHGAGQAGNFLEASQLQQFSNASYEYRSRRLAIFNRLTEPNTPSPSPERLAPSPKNMPKLRSGIDAKSQTSFTFPSLTEYQYQMLYSWARGDFIADWQGEPQVTPIDEMPMSEQPDALTRAALESCIGGPFFPGIEGTYLIAQVQTYESPFRINRQLSAGSLTERMAVPWQADFLSCGSLWWPAQRPVSVKVESGEYQQFSRKMNNYLDMVENWSQLGFVVQQGSEYIEKESKLP